MFEWAIIAALGAVTIWLALRVWYLKRKLHAVKLLETTLQGFTERVLQAAIDERRQRIDATDALDADHLEF
jgi:hypothetical protein